MCKLCVRLADVWRLSVVRTCVYPSPQGLGCALCRARGDRGVYLSYAGAMHAVTKGASAATMLLPQRAVAAGLREGRVAGGRWSPAALEEGERVEWKTGGGGRLRAATVGGAHGRGWRLDI